MPPDYGQEATQMFSQRNNPYCELLQISYKYTYKFLKIKYYENNFGIGFRHKFNWLGTR